MATVPVLDAEGKEVATQALPADLFEAPINVPLMHQVVVAGAAAARAGTRATKTRGDVSGGGRKPWRQKGTGRARQGSIRSPQWRGGGTSHGPQPKSYEMRVNKKMKKAALRSALSDALASGKIAMVDDLSFEEPKTAKAREVLDAIGASEGKVLLVLPEPQEIIERSFRNLPYVRWTYAPSLSVYEVLMADRVVLTKASLEKLSASGERGTA
jgi:large subunit ribosomal protein L4